MTCEACGCALTIDTRISLMFPDAIVCRPCSKDWRVTAKLRDNGINVRERMRCPTKRAAPSPELPRQSTNGARGLPS
jgi:hypothetical protein